MADSNKQQNIFSDKPQENKQKGGSYYSTANAKTIYDRPLDVLVSTLQKAIRRGEEVLAMSMAFEIIESGYSKYFWNRMGVIAGEDIGTANPNIMILVDSCATIFFRRLNSAKSGPFHYQAVGIAILEMCRSKKSRECDEFIWSVKYELDHKGPKPIPSYALDMHCETGREMMLKEGLTEEGKSIKWWTEGSSIARPAKNGSKYYQHAINSDERLSAEGRKMCIEYWRKAYQDAE